MIDNHVYKLLVTTMTTTGYGDITPQDDGERVFGFFAMLSGVFFYGYISGMYDVSQSSPHPPSQPNSLNHGSPVTNFKFS
jgi:hypothetical protein